MKAFCPLVDNLGLSILVIIGAALVLACDRLWPFRLPGQLVPLAWPLFAAGTLVIALAVASFVAVAHASGGVGGAPQRHVTAGPFRYLRNPIYAGAVLLLFAIAFFRQSPSFLLAAAAFVPAIDAYVRRMEEPRLRVRFGEDYAVYTRAVPRWIPRWSGWTTSYVAILAAGSLLACDVSPLANGGETPSAAAVVAAQTTMEPAVESLVCTRYVAPDGRDDAPGTEGQPWATFQHAADSAQPGDMLCFRGGVYLVEVTHLTRSGAPEAPVTFIAHPGETPVLDGQAKATELLILDQHTSHVRISGFTLRNFTIWGMALTGENRYVQLDHLAIEGGEAGIRYTYGESAESPPLEGPVEHITLEDSIIHGSQYSALDCTPGPCNDLVIRRVEIYNTGVIGSSFYGSDGLEIARGYPLLVEECIIHDNSGDGIDLNSRDRQGNASGVIVRRNYVMRNRLNGIKLWAGGRIENNVVWGQGNSALWTGTYTSTLEIINNTIAYNMWDASHSQRNWALVAGYPEEMARPPVTLTLVNNLFAFNASPLAGGATGIYLGPGVTLVRERNNLYWSREDGEITAGSVRGYDPYFSRAEIANGTWTHFSGQGQDDLAAAPLFVSDWPAIDLNLQEASPAVDAGVAGGAPIDDVNGHARDAQPDIGAHELTRP